MGNVAGHDHRAGEREPGADRMLAEEGADIVHWPVEVQFDDRAAECLVADFGQVFDRLGLQGFEKEALGRDLGEDLAVGRAGDREPDRAGGPVPRHPHDPHVVAEVLAAKLRPNPDFLTHLEHLGLHGQIAEGLAILVALGR